MAFIQLEKTWRLVVITVQQRIMGVHNVQREPIMTKVASQQQTVVSHVRPARIQQPPMRHRVPHAPVHQIRINTYHLR